MMRKIFFTCSLIVSMLFVCSTVMAQQQKKALTNADVISMVKAGLPENTIILAIQQGPTDFDTSAQTLIQLKNQGISPKILDAMIQGSKPVEAQTQTNPSPRTASDANPLSPIPGANDPISYGDVVMVDGDKRIEMKRSQINERAGGFMMQAVNPFKKTRIQGAINGNHSQLRTTNTSPMFEVGLSADLNPSDYVTLVKLNVKSDRREIEMSRAGITGVSSGFRKEDMIPVVLEELQASAGGGRLKSYRVKTVNPIPPGEYALAVGGSLLYDFGVDSTK
jgi:hypothetical protein